VLACGTTGNLSLREKKGERERMREGWQGGERERKNTSEFLD
jgi:hypothetical protein